MSTKKKKEELREITKKLSGATKKHDKAIDQLKQAERESDVSYNDLIDIRAKHSIGDASAEDVQEAEKEHQSAEQKLNQCRTDFDTQSRILELLGQKKRDARAAYISSVEAEIANQVPGKVKPVFEAIEELEKAISELTEFKRKYGRLAITDKLGTPFRQRLESLIPKSPSLSGKERNKDDIKKWKNKYKNLTKS